MNLPDNWTLVPVRGTFLDLHGSPCRGSVVFSSDQVVIVDGLVVVPRLITGTLDETGTVSVMLPSTTDPDTAPTGWVYTVIEHIRPAGRPPFKLAVPHDAGEINLDTAPIAPPVDPVDPTPYVGPRGRSAYQIAVDEGYIGSEAEWLASLVGPEGPQGPQGPQGPPGGGADLSDNAPHALGTAAPGIGTKAAREDHIHAMPTAAQVGADTAGTATGAVIAHEAAADPHPQYTTAAEAAAVAPVQTVAGRTGNVTLATADVTGAVDTADARLSDAREWTASTVTQVEAEAGTDTSRKAWSVLRVWQAIAAWWAASNAKAKLDGIAAGAEVNVNADWNAGSGDAQILNKPTLGTAAAKDVPASGDAAATEVVKGDDSRLSDARTPTAHTHPLSQLQQSGATLGQTAAWSGSAWVPRGIKVTSTVSSDTITPDIDTDLVQPTATLSAALTIANPVGTAVNGWGFVVDIKDNGTARALTWGSDYASAMATLPTATTAGKRHRIGVEYNGAASKWQCMYAEVEA